MMKIVVAALIMGQSSSTHWPQREVKGSEKGRHWGSWAHVPKARCLNRIKQQPIRSIWDNNICQMKHLTGWPDKCPASSYLEISPLVANRSGATWKGLPLAQWVAEVKSSQGYAEDKGQSRDTVSSSAFWKQAFSPIGSTLDFLLFVVSQHGTTQVPSTERIMLGMQ